MKRQVLISFIVALAAGVVLAAAQTGSTAAPAQQKPAAKAGSKMLTLSGCIEPGADQTAQPTFVDTTTRKAPKKYRLIGSDVTQYIGKRVTITGGLVPSPNVAAQAGAMDPSAAATAGRRGGASTGTGTTMLEFRVRRVVPVKGTCPPISETQR